MEKSKTLKVLESNIEKYSHDLVSEMNFSDKRWKSQIVKKKWYDWLYLNLIFPSRQLNTPQSSKKSNKLGENICNFYMR